MIDVTTESPGSTRHTLKIDAVTLAVDSDKTAPSPHDYFDAALAGCKGTTAIIYARAHNIALDKVTVHLERDNSHEREGKYVLKLDMHFEGKLSDADKAKLHEVLKRCPIHKLMTTSEVEIQDVGTASA